MNEHETPSPGETFVDNVGIKRRTIMAGAAWTIPVVAVAIATPAMAATDIPTLAFTQSSYSGTGCGTIQGVQVQRTSDGSTPDPGKAVTVTLADGYAFSDGSTSVTRTTGSNGRITLPDIEVPRKGGSSTFTATSSGLSASASVSSQSASGGVYQYQTGGNNNGPYFTTPAGSLAVGDNFILSAGDQTLVDLNGSVISTGVASAAGYGNTAGDHYVTYATDAGVYIHQSGQGSRAILRGNFSSAQAVGDAFILNNGELRDLNGGVISTGVASAAGYNNPQGSHFVTYATDAGVYIYETGRGSTAILRGNFTSAKAVGDAFVLNNGELRDLNGGVISTGVSKASGFHNSNGDHYVTYTTDAGVYIYQTGQGSRAYLTGNRTSVTPVGDAFILDNGTLRDLNGGAVATNVSSAAGFNNTPGSHYVTYIKAEC